MTNALASSLVAVTGGARGIGAAIARRLVDDGARVAIVDVLEDEARATAAALGRGTIAVACDLREPKSVADAFDAVVHELGGLDGLVNDAGIFRKTPLLDIPPDEWDDVFTVNARGTFLAIQQAAPALMARGGGAIVNIASMAAKLGTPGEAHYAASKAAVVALTRVAAMELGPHHITVNAVCPGYVLTEMGAATRTAADVAAWSAKSPLGQLTTPEQVASMVAYLLSPEGRGCTGQAVNVTAGMVMH
jgi:NAD(P)-dependent dehydrogenase (short-subunit alcohol dehydrogenase family)